MARRNPIRDALERELERLDVTDYRFEKKGRQSHPRLILLVDGHELVYVFPGTATCPRSLVNNVAALRRLVRWTRTVARAAVAADA